ncbi:MAG: NAD(P)-dependent glycerol-3-phosphate dehydrogenase [Acidimicrobiaceae bacterium]|nr:NAD(P)-dependent glycerol-3-phosphate dehydrogenase [Acidimicrobiaceae bacterium]
MSARVAVIGGGSWGTTVAHLCAYNTPTVLYVRNRAIAYAINHKRVNSRYLAGYFLHPDLRATTEIAEAVEGADVLIMAVPSQGFRNAVKQLSPYISNDTPVLSLAKGLENNTAMRMTEVVLSELSDRPVGVLTGPNLAKEIMSGYATAAVLAMTDQSATEQIYRVLAVNYFRIYIGTDVVGAEMAGATKNVIALASGIAEGLGAGNNTKAALITRGLAEMTRLGVAVGGNPLTFAGLAGMGDLVATCMSTQSRNRHVGERLGQGMSISKIVSSLGQVAEGVKSTPVVVALAKSLGVSMPIAETVQSIIDNEQSPAEALQALLDRPLTSEINF